MKKYILVYMESKRTRLTDKLTDEQISNQYVKIIDPFAMKEMINGKWKKIEELGNVSTV